MSPLVVYVHGNGNKVSADRLRGEWDLALFGRDMGVSSRMAYWASVRYAQPLSGPAIDEIERVPVSPLEATETPLDAETFIGEVVLEAQKLSPRGVAVEALAPPSPRERELLVGWLRRMTYAADALAEGENAERAPGPEALPLPRRLRIAAFRAMVKVTFKDVYAYFFGGFGEAMRDVVRATLRDVSGPIVVIGHSLGSIIAYDVLREQSDGANVVELFATVGSPLGVVEVQDLLARPLRVPASVRAWRNVSDARDLVALDHTVRPEYAPADRCQDFFVTNDSANHHGIGEYLRTAPVRQPVLELFQG